MLIGEFYQDLFKGSKMGNPTPLELLRRDEEIRKKRSELSKTLSELTLPLTDETIPQRVTNELSQEK
jgi:hypothetical protein